MKKGIDSDMEENNQDGNTANRAWRLGDFEAITRQVVFAYKEWPLAKAIAIMEKYNFSQLPVKDAEQNIAGVIDWRSIVQPLAAGKTNLTVGDCLNEDIEPLFFNEDSPLLDAVDQILTREFVFIKNPQSREIKGIITANDLSAEFRKLTEHYLLIYQIEVCLRGWITLENYQLWRVNELPFPLGLDANRRRINGKADLSFKEYLKIFNHEPYWEKFKIDYNQFDFLEKLNEVRLIRNDVLHFNFSTDFESHLETLRNYLVFLKNLKQKPFRPKRKRIFRYNRRR